MIDFLRRGQTESTPARLKRWLGPLGIFIGKIAEAGTAGYPIDVRRRLMILNTFAYLIIVSTIAFALQFGLTEGAEYRPLVLINIAIALVMLVVPFTHRINDIAGGLLILVCEYSALTLLASYLGREAGTPLHFIVGAAAPFFVFGLQRLWLAMAVVAGGLALNIYTWFSFTPATALVKISPEVRDNLYVQSITTTVVLIAVTVWYAFRITENAKAETDRLLRNILPDNVVERLRMRPDEAISDSFEEASILFSDISGFVPLARSLGAARVVDLLNVIVREFDALASVHGIEKIKTIGDAYMAAAGVPEPVPDHAQRLARMALDMLEAIARMRTRTGLDIQIRIGIATGPLMAGVIGTRKFSYDVWGDTVNLAARLENRSTPGRVLVCPACKARLESSFVLESRGEIEIKGVGLKETFFIVDEKMKSV